MAKNVSWSCPKCGITTTGYRTERGANADLRAHMNWRHPAPEPPKRDIRIAKY